MSNFKVLILGNASASPTLKRNNTSQLITINDQHYLMDCGEGTQLKLRQHHIKLQRINHIFISHLHGDHYLGLFGLLQTMHLLGRKSVLHIYCPGNIKSVVDAHLEVSESKMSYEINYHTVDHKKSATVLENDKIEVVSIPLKHRIACSGYLFKEKPKPRRINPRAVQFHNIPKHYMNRLKAGEDYVLEGVVVQNSKLTDRPLPSFSYAFCSDTVYYEPIANIIKGVDLLYHEATFTNEHLDRAKKTCHSTAQQAAQIAKLAHAKKLIIGHFSNRYDDLNVFLEEARGVFEATYLAVQDKIFEVSDNSS